MSPFIPLNQRMQWLCLFLFSIAVTLPGIMTMPPIDRDEARFAQASAQMLESGDYITIRFQDEERNKKPAGIYWLQAFSVKIFSSVEAREIWAYRIPSMLGAILAVFFTWGIGRTLFDKDTAFLAALFLGASPALMGEATIAKTDATQLAALCAVMFGFARIYMQTCENPQTEHQKYSTWINTLLVWFGFGIAFLLKGPIVLLIVTTTFLAIVLKPQREKKLTYSTNLLRALRPITGILILSVCILPWAIAIGIATEGRFFAEAIGRDLFGKIGSIQESHSGPPGYHLLLLPVLFWSVCAFLLMSTFHIYKNRNNAHIWFLISWLVPSWVLFELTATKLPHYVLPLYPAIALLIAKSVTEFFKTNIEQSSNLTTRLRYIGSILYVAVSAGVAIATLILCQLYRVKGILFSDVIFSIAITGGALFAAGLLWRRKIQNAALTMIAVTAVTTAVLFNYTLPSLDRFQISSSISRALVNLERHPIHSEHALPVIMIGLYEPSIVFLLGTNTQFIDDANSVLDALSTQNNTTLIVEQRRKDEILKLTSRNSNIQLTHQMNIEGFNYSKGDKIDLTIYTQTRSP